MQIDQLNPLGLGVLGWFLASRIRLPAAPILGPMIFVGAGASLGLTMPTYPGWFTALFQIGVGMYAGSRISRKTLGDMRAIGRSLGIVTAWTVVSSLAIAYSATLLAGMDLATSLLGSNPGGTPEMTAIALAVGASAPTVALLHALRLIATLSVVPFLARRGQVATPRLAPAVAGSVSSAITNHGSEELEIKEPAGVDLKSAGQDRSRSPAWLATLAMGAFGALLFTLAGIPGAPVVGSLLTVALVNGATGRLATPPTFVRTAAQLGIGLLVGTTLTPQAIGLLAQSMTTLLAITTATLASGLVLAGVVQRQIGGNMSTALLACAPGGLSQLPIIAEELGADINRVTVFQLTRFVCAIILLPVLFRFLL